MRFLTSTIWFFTLIVPYCFSKWIQASNGFLPQKSLAGGYDVDSQLLYVCRADGVNGKFSKASRVCRYPWRGQEIERSDYEILADVQSVWVPVTPPYFPTNQIMGSVSNGNPVYICRVLHVDKNYNRSLTIGKVDNGEAFIPYDKKELKCGKDLTCDNYEVLTIVANIPVENMTYILNGQYLTFKVRAAFEVYLLLGIGGAFKYKVTIGAMSNKVTSIGKIYSTHEVIQKTENILSDEEMKGYWIRWTSNNILEFGVEGKTKPVLSYNEIGVHEIDTVKFSSIGRNQWQIPNLVER